MKIIYCLCTIATVFAAHTAFAQTKHLAAEEDKLIKLYQRILSSKQNLDDSENIYADRFGKRFFELIKRDTVTFPWPFKRMQDSGVCAIRLSADHNLKVYSWDTWTGGTMHFFKQIYQWRSNGRIFAKTTSYTPADPGEFTSKIYQVSINEKPYYLLIGNGVGSTIESSQSVTVYTIENNKLTDTAKIFATVKKRLSRIDVYFDFFSVVDRPERPLELITYDERNKILYVPVVDSKEQVTKRNIIYTLKSNGFEFAGIESGKRK